MMTANGVANFLLVSLFLITARDRHEGVSFFLKDHHSYTPFLEEAKSGMGSEAGVEQMR